MEIQDGLKVVRDKRTLTYLFLKCAEQQNKRDMDSTFTYLSHNTSYVMPQNNTTKSAVAEGPRDALVSRNSATTKYPYRMELFA